MSDFFTVDTNEQIRRMHSSATAALPEWGLEDASLRLIKYRENAVFEVLSGDTKAAMRLHRPAYHSDDALHSELKWMKALDASGIQVPSAVASNRGEMLVSRPLEGVDGTIQIDLLEWIDGEQLGSVEHGLADASSIADNFLVIGELAAQVHNQAVSWVLPEGFERHAWDEEGLAGEQPLWGQFWKLKAATPAQTQLLERSKERLYDELSVFEKSAQNYSMIHADLVPENLLVDGGQVRLIDFDDAGFGWHLFELATSLYFILGEPHFDQASAALVEGYRKQRTLSDEDLERLPLFLLARGMTYLSWVHTRPESETAIELTPMLLELACELAEPYLSNG